MPNRLDRFFGDQPEPPEDDVKRSANEGESSPSSPETAASPLVPAVEPEEAALRERMAELGFAPVDPSLLAEGPPLTREDRQALLLFHRNRASLPHEEQARIIANRRRFASWHRADREALEQVVRELRDADRFRN